MEEFRETLSSKLSPSTHREQRKPYKFTTGAIYVGQWVGGFRDGFGTQTWSDGARYEGDWKLHKAHGKGKFFHASGDTYDGD